MITIFDKRLKTMAKNTSKAKLVKELIKGEESGLVQDFNRDKLLKELHQKYVTK